MKKIKHILMFVILFASCTTNVKRSNIDRHSEMQDFAIGYGKAANYLLTHKIESIEQFEEQRKKDSIWFNDFLTKLEALK